MQTIVFHSYLTGVYCICIYTVNREIFCYTKILLKKFGVLKNFRRVDVLRKYFNMKILQHSVCNSVARVGEETYGESNCHGRDF